MRFYLACALLYRKGGSQLIPQGDEERMNLIIQMTQYLADYITSWQLTLQRLFYKSKYSKSIGLYKRSDCFASSENVLLVVQPPLHEVEDLIKSILIFLVESGVNSIIFATGDARGCIDLWNELCDGTSNEPRIFVQPIELHNEDDLKKFVFTLKEIRKCKLAHVICIESSYFPIDRTSHITTASLNLIQTLYKESLFLHNFKLVFVTIDLWLLLRKSFIIPSLSSLKKSHVTCSEQSRPFVSYYTGPSCSLRVKSLPRFTQHSPYSLGHLVSWFCYLMKITFSCDPHVSSSQVVHALQSQGPLNAQNLLSLIK